MAGEAAAALFQVITQRYLKSSIVLTTNLGVAVLGQDLRRPDGRRRHARPAAAPSVVFNIDGESYRMRTHRARADKLRATAGTPP